MRESRLFQILYQLLTKKKVTAANLAKQFEVSVRTIYRDIDALSSSGIPIYASQGKNGGIQLDRQRQMCIRDRYCKRQTVTD